MRNALVIVVNRAYQKYLPYYVYFAFRLESKGCDIKVFAAGEKISSGIKKLVLSIEPFGDSKVVFDESSFSSGYDTSNNQILKSFRWTINRDMVEAYDNIYIGDVDILLCREGEDLFVQHLSHCEKTHLPYSNSVRNIDHTKSRLSGLHFVKCDEYYSLAGKTIEKYSRLLKENGTKVSNEENLYRIVEESGMGFPKKWWRPHHGIHLGLWRNGGAKISPLQWSVIGRDRYREHYQYFLEIDKEPELRKLYRELPLEIIESMKAALKREFEDEKLVG